MRVINRKIESDCLTSKVVAKFEYAISKKINIIKNLLL